MTLYKQHSLLQNERIFLYDETTTLYSDGATLKGDNIAQRQVIGVMDSGETRVLAEYTGTFWSLLDSKWSLKQTNVENQLFELLGTRVVCSAVSLQKILLVLTV